MDWNKKVTEKDIAVFLVIVGVIVGFYFVYVNFIPKTLFNREKQISVEIIEITGDCEDCFDLEPLTQGLLSENVKLKSKKSLEYGSEEAKKLIDKYSIEKVPALVVISKNIDELDVNTQFFELGDNYAVFDKAVPYIDFETDEVKGLVELKEIYDSTCEDCSSLSGFQKQLEDVGVKVKNYKAVESSTDEGKVLIEENSLSFVPTLLISKEIEEYWWIFEQLKSSLIENENYYVLENPVSPYKDLASGKVKGKVDITYLTDSSCEDCYNATQLKSSFQSLGVYIDEEKTYDVSSSIGKSLLGKYNITAVPTVILSKELGDYKSLKEMLEEIGTFESDGSFVFRKLEVLNVKYNKIS